MSKTQIHSLACVRCAAHSEAWQALAHADSLPCAAFSGSFAAFDNVEEVQDITFCSAPQRVTINSRRAPRSRRS